MSVVSRLLRGEPLDLVARDTNVSVAKLTEWRERALEGAASASKGRERDERDDEIARLKSKVGEITMDNELLHGEGYRKIWARLRAAGVRASPRRVRRVMGEHGLLAPHRAGRTEAKAHDGTIVTDRVNEMWGTDMTQTITTNEGKAYVFVAVEHANSEIVGIHAARSANRFEALEPVRQGVHRCFGTIAPGVAHGLKLRHDHGSNYMSRDFQDEIECLGIEASPSFVREPEGNGVAERFIRTLKENLLWVRVFDTVEELRQALQEFAHHYNENWLVARHNYQTPTQVRAAQLRVANANVGELSFAA